jgi:hypothetical protein
MLGSRVRILLTRGYFHDSIRISLYMGLTNNYLFFYWNLSLGGASITYTETLKGNKGGKRK